MPSARAGLSALRQRRPRGRSPSPSEGFKRAVPPPPPPPSSMARPGARARRIRATVAVARRSARAASARTAAALAVARPSAARLTGGRSSSRRACTGSRTCTARTTWAHATRRRLVRRRRLVPDAGTRSQRARAFGVSTRAHAAAAKQRTAPRRAPQATLHAAQRSARRDTRRSTHRRRVRRAQQRHFRRHTPGRLGARSSSPLGGTFGRTYTARPWLQEGRGAKFTARRSKKSAYLIASSPLPASLLVAATARACAPSVAGRAVAARLAARRPRPAAGAARMLRSLALLATALAVALRSPPAVAQVDWPLGSTTSTDVVPFVYGDSAVRLDSVPDSRCCAWRRWCPGGAVRFRCTAAVMDGCTASAATTPRCVACGVCADAAASYAGVALRATAPLSNASLVRSHPA